MLTVISHPACADHEMGYGHPEQPARLQAIADAIDRSSLTPQKLEATRADREQLVRVHDPDYVDRVYASAPTDGLVRLDADTAMSPGSLDASLYAAGAAVAAVDLVLGDAETTTNVFCAVRPPGHHAERGRSMGFCLFDNVAVAAAHALEGHGLERVAVVDFDVHHGNGTEDIFRDDPRVLACSSFQHPFYPFSGADSTSDHILNVPLAAGTDGVRFRQAVAPAWLDQLDRFAPELILFAAGFDAHRQDPLGGLGLEEDDFHWVTTAVKGVADAHAGGRTVSTLEGGYDLDALGTSVVAHLEALAAR